MSEQSGADLSRLRINREETPKTNSGGGGGTGRAILLYAFGAIVVGLGIFFLIRTLTEEPELVDIDVAAYISPSMDRTVLTASGYVVTQRNLLTRDRSVTRLTKRLRAAFDDRVVVLPPCGAGNTVALAAKDPDLRMSPAELREAARRLKTETGLDLSPTLERLDVPVDQCHRV